VKSAGRVGWRSIVYFEVVSTIALMFGLLFGNLLEIGKGMTAAGSATLPATAAKAAPQGFAEFVMHVVPDNFVGAFAKGELLQVVVLAVMVGIGILAIPEGRREKINTGLDYISEVLFSFINLVMKTPSTSSLPMNVRLQSRCSASADALKVMGFLDRGRGTGLAKGTTVSVINVIPVASR